MYTDLSFVPKILLCGDEADFFSCVGERPFKIVDHAKISGEGFDFVRDGKLFFGGKVQDLDALANYLRSGAVDYFVFTTMQTFAPFRNNAYARGFLSSQVVTVNQFRASTKGFLYDVEADFRLLLQLKNFGVKTLLDVDAYFSRGKIFTKIINDSTEMDAVTEKILSPITENFYAHVYKNLSEVGLKHYDAALITEREPVDFDSMFAMLENFSDKVITFARKGSNLERYIFSNAKIFAEAVAIKGGAVDWYLITRRKPPEDFKIYVVTHKPTPHDGKLPAGYEIIHAGHAQAEKELGYAGDDTGDNISRLNLYLNEITALYWLWKNTNHTTIGLCHYRRFFTESNDATFAAEKILTQDAALRILNRYDIIVSEPYYGSLTQREFIVNDCGNALAVLGEAVIKKYLLQVQPDYLDAFEYVMDSTTFYKCNMFVTRKNIFEAYCRWLFSFYLDATKEILRTAELEKITDNRRRVMGFFSERMMTTWLWKNRLRIKELKIMQVE